MNSLVSSFQILIFMKITHYLLGLFTCLAITATVQAQNEPRRGLYRVTRR